MKEEHIISVILSEEDIRQLDIIYAYMKGQSDMFELLKPVLLGDRDESRIQL